MMRTGRFEDQVAVVTGGAGGIGAQVCAAIAREGGQVAVIDLDPDVAAEAAAQLTETVDRPNLGYGCDVSSARNLDAVMEHIAADFGRIDVVVALAGGSFGAPRATSELTADQVDRILDVNAKGTLHTVRAALPHLTGPTPAVVTVASLAARQASGMAGAAYAGAKAAITGMTRSLAHELGDRGIRVNAICPGLVLTERLEQLYASMDADQRASILGAIPLGRFPDICEIVEPLLFLASAQSSYITGVVLDVNGGRFMAP